MFFIINGIHSGRCLRGFQVNPVDEWLMKLIINSCRK